MRREYYNPPVTRINIDKSAFAFHNRHFEMLFLNAPGLNEPMDTMLGKPVALVLNSVQSHNYTKFQTPKFFSNPRKILKKIVLNYLWLEVLANWFHLNGPTVGYLADRHSYTIYRLILKRLKVF